MLLLLGVEVAAAEMVVLTLMLMMMIHRERCKSASNWKTKFLLEVWRCVFWGGVTCCLDDLNRVFQMWEIFME